MRSIALGLLWIYQRFVSPLLPAACRFHPSCSEYARQAIVLHGFLKGSLLSLWRLLRCQPWCEGGFDPVPERFSLTSRKLKAS